MKSRFLFRLPITVFLFLCAVASHAVDTRQRQADSISILLDSLYSVTVTPDTMDKWMTVGQFESYCDSIYRSRHPELPFIENKEYHGNKILKDEGNPQRSISNLYINNYVPSSVNIDTSLEVGQIEIESGISSTGGKTYSVPIKVYEGNGVFAPSVSLNYNSQGNYGIAGKGWSIGGISTITRGSLSEYYDGNTIGQSNTIDDAFYLDGVRLICTNPTNHLYETETGHIIVKGTVNGTNYKEFEVYYPNGWKGLFGISSGLEYPITQLTNERGQKIKYFYTYDAGRYLPWTIDYASDNHYGSISFTYGNNRADHVRGYQAGQDLDSYKILKSIKCTYNSVQQGLYTLTHTTDNGTSLLTQIDYSAKVSPLNPLRFYYGEGNTSPRGYEKDSVLLQYGYTASARGLLRAIRGRFDYESGEDAIIYYPNENPYYQNLGSGNNYFSNNYNSQMHIHLYSGLGSAVSNPMPYMIADNGFVEMLFADLDGNLNECPVKVNNTASSSGETLTFKVYKPYSVTGYTLYSTSTFNLSTSYGDGNGHYSVQPKFYYAGDFTGDGKMEILAVSANNPFGDNAHPSKCYLFDLNNNQIIYQGSPFSFNKVFESNSITGRVAEYNSDKLMAIDVDGDGKMELCHFHSDGMAVYSFMKVNGVLSAYLLKQSTYPSKNAVSDRFYSCGDFNGDGLTDIILSPFWTIGGTDWGILASMGNGCFSPKTFTGPQMPYPNTDLCVQDIDGDGISDFAKITGDELISYLFKNYTATQDATTTLPDDKCTVASVNVNSSTLCNQFIAINGYKPVLYAYNFNQQRGHALTGMVNSNGVVEKNYYYTIQPGAYQQDIYTLGYYNSATSPCAAYNSPLMLLAGNEVFMRGQSQDINKYYYDTAVLHRQGLGFRGFYSIRTDNKREQSSYQNYNPQNYSVLESVITPTSETTFTNNISVAANKILTSQVTSCVKEDLLTGTTATTNYTYDAYGNVLSELTSMDGNISINKYNTYYNYNDISTRYRLGLLSTSETTTARGLQSGSFTESVDISYNNFSQPLSVVKSINGSRASTITMTYNNNGYLTSRSEMPFDSYIYRTTNYQYDYFNRLTRVTEPTGTYKQFTYNSDGKLATTQTYTGTTSYTYDILGRLILEERPDTTQSEKYYAWNNNTGDYSVTTCETGQPDATVCYDAMNRETQDKRIHFDGQISVIEKDYDSYGRLSQKSLPYFENTGSPIWQSYSYDQYDRLIRQDDPSGKTTTYSYNGLSTTVTDETSSVTTTRDALGSVVSVTDPAGTISYTLNGAGNPVSITSPGNIITSVYYDLFGRRIQYNDPSHGSVFYTYDVAGNLIMEEDANNAITRYYYDNYGRMTSKEIDTLTTVYTYDNNLNKLTSMVSSNGTSETYTYDSFGRLSSSKETGINSVWLQKDYTYSSGQIASTSYTSSYSGALATENYTYANGYLTQINLDNGTVVFKLNADNQFGQPTNVTTGDLTRTYGYDSYGFPTLRKTQRSSTIYQDMSYIFNAQTGNLSSRTDNIYNLTENFTYDNLKRLTSFGGNNVTYDVNGNISSLSNVGSFAYNTTDKPYAVSDVMLSNNSITLGNQDVSYYPFNRPSSITENGNTYILKYNGNYERVSMEATVGNNTGYVRHYLGGQYELENPNSIREWLYLGGNYYTAPVVICKQNNHRYVFYLLRDHLGSVTNIILNNTQVREYSYDAWGRLRDPQTHTLYTLQNEPSIFIGRGYCGHEHIKGTGLINMNARLYDPLIGRFLSPDPYVQAPMNSQNFNRYSYCLNNPLVYKDEDGEFFGTIFAAITDACANLFKHGFNVSQYNWTKTVNAWKIDITPFRGKPLNVLSNLTWGLRNTLIGNVLAHVTNMSGWTDGVSHMDGMTAIGGITSGNSAMTIGPYSFGPKNYKATWKDNLFVHEYGHYIQHLYWGHFYLPVIAVPSLLSTQHVGSGSHKDRWFEIDASNKGARHFNKYYGSESAAYEEEYVGTNGRVDKSKYFSWETFVGGWQYYKSPRLYDKPDLPQDCIFHTDFNGVQFFDFSIPLISSMFIQ